MGSRIRSSSDQLLVCWCEVVGGEGRDQPPWIIQKFPNTYDDTETLKIIPQFVFPCMIERNAVQNFSFVLTSVESTFTFGYCRHSPTSNSAMVILSYLPWDSTFYKILKQCSEIQSSQSPDDMWLFLQALYHSPVPEPGSKLTVCYPPNNSMFIADCPNHLGLPSIPEDRNLMEYYSAVDANTMMLIFASMLFERRILVSSRQLHRLSSCVQAANALLYPMTWQHIFIPVLPESMLEYLHAPMPFLIGVPQSLMEKVHLDEIGEVVYLDADANKCLTPFKDLDELPNEVASYLTRKLNPREKTMDDSVPRAFLRALVMLIGNYQDALQIHEGNKRIVFNHEKFIAGRPQNVKSFVVKMLELQIFNQFIEERIDRLSNGLATSDEFEMELSVYGDKHPRRNFMQAIKNFKSKTNPAMKSAAKTVARTSKQVKERGKEIKGMLPKLPHSKSPEHSSNRDPELRSAPSSPVAPKRRPNTTMFVPNVSYTRSNTTLPNTRKSSHSTPAALSPESPHPPSIDLMGELQQELQNILPDRPPPPPSSSSSSSSRPLTRPTTLPPPIPTSSAAVSSPSKGLTIPNSGKDEDLILLGGSPQDEVDDFDPLLSKSVSNADTSSSSSTTPHPLHSFLHSNLHKHVSDSQPYSSLPSHISRPSYGQPLGIPFTSAPSPSSTTHPSLPRTVSSPSAAQSSAGAAGAAQKSSRRSSVQPSDHRSSSTMGGAARAVLSSTAPSLPVPVRKGSTPSRNHQGASSTIPSATMAALPAALQQHLASKLDSSSSSSSNPSNFTPFASLQSTSPRPPLMQTNPAYNNHVPPQQSSSRSAAAMFASSLLDAGSDAHVSNNIVNINNNNETAASKHLLSEFSDTFAQMSLNKKECEVKVEPAPTKHNWMSFE